MSEFKVGDWVFTNDDVTPYVYEIIYKKGEHYKLRSKNGVRYCREWRIDRHATEGEIKAGYRAESFEFDKYWYGQSEADAIKEHEALQDELIKGGVVFVGNNSNIIQMVNDMGDDFPIENRISPNCKVTEAHINEADKLNRLG
ncbi:hypothetical protein OHV73_00790 [Acinetobacter baumannii]|nr:hypothetical protein [Acinetobacter baumannii]